MPTDNADRLPADAIPSQARIDPWAWGVRVALLLLISPALLLVLIVGGLFLLMQTVSRDWNELLGQLGRGRTPRSIDLARRGKLPRAVAVAPAAGQVETSLVCRDRPA
jgi:hypothetical protein